MSEEADNINTTDDTFPLFHGYSSQPGSQPGSQAGSQSGSQTGIHPGSQPGVPMFRCPLFNKEGVTNGEGSAKAVVDYTSTEWRKLMTKYGRRVKVVQADFTNLTRTGGRPGDIRMEAMQRAMHECESMLDNVLDTIADQAETWYNDAGRTRSEQSSPEGLESYLRVIDSESVRVKSDFNEMMNPITAFLESMRTPRPTTPVEPTATMSFSRYQPDKTLRPEFKIDQNSNYGTVYTDVHVKLRAYLNSGLVGCPNPGADQIETHVNLFLDEPTRVAYIRRKKERSEKTPPLQTNNISGVIDCLLDVLLRR